MSEYGALIIRVTGDTKPLRDDAKRGAEQAGKDAASGISQSMNTGLKAVGGLGLAVGKSVATGLGAASAAAIGFGVASFQSAARVSEMNASLKALAQANNLSYPAMQQTVTQIRKQGIEAGVAQGLVAEFAKNQLKLADATKLATVAQDAAVISGRNSTEVLDDLLHGIVTQNSLVLRNAGLNVQAGKAMEDYAKSVGKATKDLTESERAQAVLNATLEKGATVAGAYELAMKEPGKVLRSFPRLIDDIKISIGTGLVNAFKDTIIGAYDLAKAFSLAIEPGGKLAPIFDAIGAAVARLTAPLAGMIASWAKWLEGLKPDQINKAVDAIKQFGPAAMIAGAALATMTGASVLGGLPIIGTLVKSLLGPVTALGPVVKAVGGAFLSWGGAMSGATAGATGLTKALAIATGPIGWIIAALVAVTLASGKFRTALLDVGKALVAGLMPVISAVVGGFKAILPPIMDVARALGDALGPILTRLAPLLQPIGALVGGVLVVAFGALGVALRVVAAVIVGLLGIFERLVELIPVEPIRSFASACSAAIGAAAAFANPLRLLADFCRTLSDAISAVVRWIFGGSPGLIPAFLAAAAAAGPLMAVLSALMGVFRALASVVASVVSTMVSAVSSGFSTIASLATAGASAVRNAVTSGFNAARSLAVSAMSAISSAVSSGFSAAASAARSGTSAIQSAVSSAFAQVRSIISSTMSQVSGMVSSGLSAAVGAARAGGAAIMSGLQAGIQSAAGAVMSTISSVASNIAGALSSALRIGSPSRLTIPMGEALAEGLSVGYERGVDHLEFSAPVVGLGAGSSPLIGPGASLQGFATGSITVNVYPQPGQDERQIAAAVSRELAWSVAGGVL